MYRSPAAGTSRDAANLQINPSTHSTHKHTRTQTRARTSDCCPQALGWEIEQLGDCRFIETELPLCIIHKSTLAVVCPAVRLEAADSSQCTNILEVCVARVCRPSTTMLYVLNKTRQQLRVPGRGT